MSYNNFVYYGKHGNANGIWCIYDNYMWSGYIIDLYILDKCNRITKNKFKHLTSTDNIKKLKKIFGE